MGHPIRTPPAEGCDRSKTSAFDLPRRGDHQPPMNAMADDKTRRAASSIGSSRSTRAGERSPKCLGQPIMIIVRPQRARSSDAVGFAVSGAERPWPQTVEGKPAPWPTLRVPYQPSSASTSEATDDFGGHPTSQSGERLVRNCVERSENHARLYSAHGKGRLERNTSALDNQHVTPRMQMPRAARNPPTWESYKSAVRRVDRDSLLARCAEATAAMSRGEVADERKAEGFLDWNVADVARTALAWGGFQRPEADGHTLRQLCNMNAVLIDEGEAARPDPSDRLAHLLPRMIFEQFPRQRSPFDLISRTLLLFGSASELPPGYKPKAMVPGWFESITGLTLDDYVESIFIIWVGAQQSNGAFSLEWLDGPGYKGLEHVFSFDAVRKTFTEQLLTTPDEFKAANRRWQDRATSPQKKFAFNPLISRPFIDGTGEFPIAPWVQAIVAKASPASIYHLGFENLGKGFPDDLGHVFQHYVGRQLGLIEHPQEVIPELRYGPARAFVDSCDWFLDLPGMLVLIECKSRQPIENLRIGSDAWIDVIADSTGHGIEQLNKSHRNIDVIGELNPRIDPGKPRVGLVVTMEPFYINENWFVRERLTEAEFPIGVISAGELESLVTLGAHELAEALRDASDKAQDNVLLLTQALNRAQGRENPLVVSTFDSIGLIGRTAEESKRRRLEAS